MMVFGTHSEAFTLAIASTNCLVERLAHTPVVVIQKAPTTMVHNTRNLAERVFDSAIHNTSHAVKLL